jgi:hypothetical protein
MQGGEGGYADGEEGAAHVKAAALDSSAALQRAWCNAEHCLPLDDVVRREVWDGSIPIRLELAKQDVSTFEPPMPFYLQVLVTWFFFSCVCATLVAWPERGPHAHVARARCISAASSAGFYFPEIFA